MMNLEQFKNMTVGKSIGFNGSHGECGGYASYWFSELTGNKYQFAYGKPNINAKWAIGSDCYTAWNVASQADWGAMGFEKIINPSFSQLKAGDIFFISARSGLPTGHVGIVYSVANNNVTTLEQNFGGARYVQFMPGANSWSYYGGFSCIVRPKQTKDNKNNQKNGEIDMFIIKTLPHGKYKNGAYWITDGVSVRHIGTTRMLEAYRKMGVKEHQMWQTELDAEFEGSKIIYKK